MLQLWSLQGCDSLHQDTLWQWGFPLKTMFRDDELTTTSFLRYVWGFGLDLSLTWYRFFINWFCYINGLSVSIVVSLVYLPVLVTLSQCLITTSSPSVTLTHGMDADLTVSSGLSLCCVWLPSVYHSSWTSGKRGDSEEKGGKGSQPFGLTQSPRRWWRCGGFDTDPEEGSFTLAQKVLNKKVKRSHRQTRTHSCVHTRLSCLCLHVLVQASHPPAAGL